MKDESTSACYNEFGIADLYNYKGQPHTRSTIDSGTGAHFVAFKLYERLSAIQQTHISDVCRQRMGTHLIDIFTKTHQSQISTLKNNECSTRNQKKENCIESLTMYRSENRSRSILRTKNDTEDFRAETGAYSPVILPAFNDPIRYSHRNTDTKLIYLKKAVLHKKITIEKNSAECLGTLCIHNNEIEVPKKCHYINKPRLEFVGKFTYLNNNFEKRLNRIVSRDSMVGSSIFYRRNKMPAIV